MGATLVRSVVGLLLLAAVFGLVQRAWPAVRQPARRWRDLGTDLVYWIVTPQVTRVVTKVVVVLVAGVWAVLVTRQTDPQALVTAFSSRSPVGAQPVWLQAVEVVVLGDLLGYWIHRAFHAGTWWRFHAIHHSAERLSWLSSTRLHPVNDLLGGLLRTLPFFLLGFRLEVLAGVLPGLAIYGLLLHANVRWSFGPLRYVIASPAFHRWHHAAGQEGRDKNFAGLLPVWDLMFGTFHMPGRAPERCGVDEAVPKGFLGQMVWPWRGGGERVERCGRWRGREILASEEAHDGAIGGGCAESRRWPCSRPRCRRGAVAGRSRRTSVASSRKGRPTR